MRGLDEADAELIDSLLNDIRQAEIATDRHRLEESHESWVHGLIKAEGARSPSGRMFASPSKVTEPS